MHDDQVATSVDLVGALLGEQFPRWAALPIVEVDSYGTDHDVYRLGDELCVRLPIIASAAGQVRTDAEWLPRLAPHLPLAVPTQLAGGSPGAGYPFAWSVCTWVPGGNAVAGFDDPVAAAVDLAGFICALRSIDTQGAPVRSRGRRGAPLAELAEAVESSIAELGDRVDAGAVRRAWRQSLEAPVWSGPQVWLHGDLLAGNLIVAGGRLSGVIDFGGLNVGDPACDLQPAWNLFSGASRERFFVELTVDEAARLRGRGWTLAQAVNALAYYWETNPGMVAQTSRALAEVLADTA